MRHSGSSYFKNAYADDAFDFSSNTVGATASRPAESLEANKEGVVWGNIEVLFEPPPLALAGVGDASDAPLGE